MHASGSWEQCLCGGGGKGAHVNSLPALCCDFLPRSLFYPEDIVMFHNKAEFSLILRNVPDSSRVKL